jgi:catalase (peroxidase I)
MTNIDKIINDTFDRQAEFLEMFAAAYYKVTDIDPRESVLVQQVVGETITWRFEPKSKFNFRTVDGDE